MATKRASPTTPPSTGGEGDAKQWATFFSVAYGANRLSSLPGWLTEIAVKGVIKLEVYGLM